MAAKRTLIVPSQVSDVYKLAATLRAEDAAEASCFGVNAANALRRAYRNGILRRTAFVDGEIAAMWGLCGAMLCDVGHPYLITSAAVEKVPLTMVKQAKNEIEEMLRMREYLQGYVAVSYDRACKFLQLLGFNLGEIETFGPKSTPFYKFEMRRSYGS